MLHPGFVNALVPLDRSSLLGVSISLLFFWHSTSIILSQDESFEEIPTPILLQRLETVSEQRWLDLGRAILQRPDVDVETRLKLVNKFIEQYADVATPQDLGSAHLDKMRIYAEEQLYTEALEQSDLAAEQGEKCIDAFPVIKFEALVGRSHIYLMQGDFVASTRFAKEAVKFAADHGGDKLMLGKPYRMLAICATQMGFNDKAVDYLRQEYDYAQRVGSKPAAIAALEAIATEFLKVERSDEAELWLNRAEALLAEAPDERMRIMIQHRRYTVDALRGNFEAAAKGIRELTQKDLSALHMDDKRIIFTALYKVLLKLKEYQEALDVIEVILSEYATRKAAIPSLELDRLRCWNGLGRFSETIPKLIDLKQKYGRISEIEEIRLSALATAYQGVDDFEAAYNTLRECQKVAIGNAVDRRTTQLALANAMLERREDELQVVKAQKAQATAEAKAEQKESEARLASINALLAAERASHARWMQNYYIIAGGLGMLFVGLLIHIRGQRVLQKKEKQLSQQLAERLRNREKELRESAEERRKLELAVEERKRENVVSQLIGGVAHDFNNLLTVVLHSNAMVELCESELSDDSREMLQASTRAGETGAQIVRQLLSIIRRSTIAPHNFGLNDWLEQNRQLLRSSVGNFNRFEIDNQAGNPLVHGDPNQMTTAVINLLSNARDAVDVDGRIRVVLLQLDPKHVLHGATDEIDASDMQPHSILPAQEGEREFGWVQIRVEDNGCGMTQEQLERACDPFFTSKGPGAGLGLGLSTASAFIQHFGGTLRFESACGAGTTAIIELPAVSPGAGRSKSAHSDPVDAAPRGDSWAYRRPLKSHLEPISGLDVMIVDDQPDVRESTTGVLEALGCRVRQAENGDSALQQLLQDGFPDILLSDIRMPGSMDGIELCRRVSSLAPQTRNLLMTGFSDTLPDDIGNVLAKPFSFQQLQDAVASVAADKNRNS